MRLPYKGAGIALFLNEKSTGEYSILLGKRSINPGRGKWSIPGGGFDVRRDEDLSNTAEREFWEETGIKFRDLCKTQKHDVMWIRFPLFTWKTILAETESADFMTRLNVREFSDLKFIPLSELKNYELAFGVKKEVRVFKRILRKKLKASSRK